MSMLVESETTRRSRRRLRTLMTLIVVGALLFGAFYYAKSYWDKPKQDNSTATSTAAPTTACPTVTAKPAPTNTFVLNVYNATKRSGLAAKISRAAGDRGYKIGTVANDPLRRKIEAPGEIRYGKAGEANAKAAQVLLPNAVMVADTRADASVDLVLGDAFTELAAAAPATPGC